jgi:ferredoxin
MDVLVLEGDEIKIQFQEECNLCEVCMDVCPNDAINIEE